MSEKRVYDVLYVEDLLKRIERLEATTVTTKYHDKIVQDAINQMVVKDKRIDELEGALTDLFAMMDEMLLVRNIENDDDPLWSLHALNFTRRLQKAHQALGEDDE